MSLSRVAWSLRSSARFFVLPIALTSLLWAGCSDDDDDDDGADSSSSIEQKVLLEVAVKVQPNTPLLNGEEENKVIHDGRPVPASSGDDDSDDPLAAIANGAPVDVKTGGSSSSSAEDAGEDEED